MPIPSFSPEHWGGESQPCHAKRRSPCGAKLKIVVVIVTVIVVLAIVTAIVADIVMLVTVIVTATMSIVAMNSPASHIHVGLSGRANWARATHRLLQTNVFVSDCNLPLLHEHKARKPEPTTTSSP